MSVSGPSSESGPNSSVSPPRSAATFKSSSISASRSGAAVGPRPASCPPSRGGRLRSRSRWCVGRSGASRSALDDDDASADFPVASPRVAPGGEGGEPARSDAASRRGPRSRSRSRSRRGPSRPAGPPDRAPAVPPPLPAAPEAPEGPGPLPRRSNGRPPAPAPRSDGPEPVDCCGGGGMFVPAGAISSKLSIGSATGSAALSSATSTS